ncbi:transcriptional regulator, LacI family [Paramicrobacterium humi]|uniref:Transcriptional regulator, LacI family n=1 Tax=Paramicrobacterium humi TaxID=640635 RepID=A0A1H4K9U1_9MICO|nr:LacI family DNA-binding transcriptional regulator [Microbacterium humi]SEB54915.1 transcriptional regulator, LacI family [Microbacterium humi]
MTLSAVARKAGVSLSTVSRYVKGELHVTSETATQIHAAMDELGYSPKRQKGRESRVALIVPDLSNPYFADLADVVSRTSAEQGLDPFVAVSGGISSREQQLLTSLSTLPELHGILYVGMNRTNPSLITVAERTPVVVLDEPVVLKGKHSLPFVGADNFSGAYQATNYLLSLNHERIAHIGGPEDLESARERLRGFSEALSSHGHTPDDELIFRGPYSESFGASVLTYVLRLDPRPTALVVSSDIVAVGIISAAEQNGVRIPDDLSIIGFDGIGVGAWLRPKLTTVVQPVQEIVTEGLRQLRRGHNGERAQTHSLPMVLRIRESSSARRP